MNEPYEWDDEIIPLSLQPSGPIQWQQQKQQQQSARCGCNPTCSCLVTTDDTNCIATSVSGLGTPTNPYIIKADPIISPDPNNTLTCTAQGLLAQGANVVAQDTNCINMTVTEAPNNTFTISADPIIDPDANNALLCRPTGLFVSTTAVTVDALQTDCLDLQITGNGSPATPFLISGTPIISPDAGNLITCTPNGLFVTPTNVVAIDNAQNIDVVEGPDNTLTFTCVPVPVVSNDPTCLQVTGDTCNGLAFDLIIDPDVCNGLECRPGGLWAEQQETRPGDFGSNPITGFSAGPFNGNFNTVIGAQSCTALITNPSQCKALYLELQGGFSVDYGRTSGDFQVLMDISVDGGATFTSLDYTSTGTFAPEGVSRNRAQSVRNGGIAGIPPGGSFGPVCARMRVIGNNVVNGVITNLSYNINIHPEFDRA